MRLGHLAIALLTLVATGALATGGQAARATRAGRDTADFRAFKPSLHGFTFVNHFEGSPLPIDLGAFEHKLGTPSTFGLCGGMSFAAADFFIAGRTPPARTKPPSRGDRLYDYITSRQNTSLGPGFALAARFGRWMALPDDGLLGTRALSAAELEHITTRLSRGEPVILGLVLDHHPSNKEARGPVGPAWNNHQVLAYEARDLPLGGGAIDLAVYDPNYPKNDQVVIRCRPVITDTITLGPWGGVQVPVFGAACERVTSQPGLRAPSSDGNAPRADQPARQRTTLVRGVFAMDYTPQTPPADLE